MFDFLKQFSSLFSSSSSSSSSNPNPPPSLPEEHHLLFLSYKDGDFSRVENFVKVYAHLGVKFAGDINKDQEYLEIPDGVSVVFSGDIDAGDSNETRLITLLVNTFAKYKTANPKQNKIILIRNDLKNDDSGLNKWFKEFLSNKQEFYKHNEIFMFSRSTAEKSGLETRLIISAQDSMSPYGRLEVVEGILHFYTNTATGSHVFSDICTRPGLTRVEVTTLANQHGARPDTFNLEGEIPKPVTGTTVFTLNGVYSAILGKNLTTDGIYFDIRSVDLEKSLFLLQSNTVKGKKVHILSVKQVKDILVANNDPIAQRLLDADEYKAAKQSLLDLTTDTGSDPIVASLLKLKTELQFQAGKAGCSLDKFIDEPSDALTKVLSTFLTDKTLHQDVTDLVEHMYLSSHKKSLTLRVNNAVMPKDMPNNNSNNRSNAKK